MCEPHQCFSSSLGRVTLKKSPRVKRVWCTWFVCIIIVPCTLASKKKTKFCQFLQCSPKLQTEPMVAAKSGWTLDQAHICIHFILLRDVFATLFKVSWKPINFIFYWQWSFCIKAKSLFISYKNSKLSWKIAWHRSALADMGKYYQGQRRSVFPSLLIH